MGEKSVDEKYMGGSLRVNVILVGEESLGETTAGEKYMVEPLLLLLY